MSYDPTDPGPVLDTYDPNWKARFQAAETMLAAVRARGEPVRDRDLCAQLTQELLDAHEAQYQYAWQYDAALRERYGGLPRSVDPTLHIPSPPHTASPAQMRVHYATWREAWDYRWFVSLLPPAVEWGTGVFAQTPPVGVTRTMDEATVEASRTCLPVRMTLVVERHPGTTHVCAIQGPEDCASVTNNLELVADWMAERFLPRPRFLAGLRGSRQRLVFHHTYTPTLNRLGRQPVWSYDLRWTRRGVRIDALEALETTPFLRDRSLELGPGARADMALV